MEQITVAEVWQEYLKISRQYHEITVEVAGALTATTNKMKAIETGLEGARQAGVELHQLRDEIASLSDKIDSLAASLQDFSMAGEGSTLPAKQPWWYEEKNVLIAVLALLVLVLLGFRLSGKNFHIEAPGHEHPPVEESQDPDKP